LKISSEAFKKLSQKNFQIVVLEFLKDSQNALRILKKFPKKLARNFEESSKNSEEAPGKLSGNFFESSQEASQN